MRFGEQLRTLRARAGLTQRELALRTGLSTAAIRDLEQGRTRSPKAESVEVIAAALGVDATAFREAEQPEEIEPAGTGPVRVAILGPLEVWRGPVRVRVESDQQRALLGRLALSAGSPVGPDELVELLWADAVPANAAELLQTRVARLRRTLEPAGPVIVGDRAGYRLEATPESLDLLGFRALIAAGDPRAAIELWRGETDVEALTHDPRWRALAHEYADTVRAAAVESRAEGDPEAALHRLRDLAARHELDEPLHVELIRTLAAADRQAEALTAYDQIRTALVRELGVDPGERLRAAHLAVLRQESPAVLQTPSAPPDFVGRAAELAQLAAALSGQEAISSRVVLINGIAGVGKTALALTAAHRLRAAYPDGQLYADLRGNDSATAPLKVLGRFLRALGVPSRRISTDESEVAAVLRSELANRRMLIVLDNARDAQQVRSLLPGAGPSDAIVTSRRRLADLDAVAVVDLEPLPQDDAIRLITSTARIGPDQDGVDALAEACARLPLALRIAGSRLATRREWSVADLARRLADSNRRLSELRVGESSVLTSLELGYSDLGTAAQRAFRLCSLHPGDDFSADSTAVLLGTPTAEAEHILEDLLEANMLMQLTKDRYRFHDLLGLYAGRLCAADAEAGAAQARLHTWYAEAVTAAIGLAYPRVVRLSAHPEPARFFSTETAALAWLDAELPSLLAVVHEAPELSWRIVDQLRGYFLMNRHADGWLAAAQAGAAATDDDRVQVAMLINRGQALAEVGRDSEALADCLAAHVLAVAVGWPAAASYVAHQLGWFQLERGVLPEAELWMRRALELVEGEEHVRAIILNGLGVARLYQGELDEAADMFTAALEIEQLLGIRGNLASALRQLGAVDDAAAVLDDVLRGYQERADRRGELSTLDEQARLHSQLGSGDTALTLALRAHELANLLRDRKAQAQTAGAVAQANLTRADFAAAVNWSNRCLAIAAGVYPHLQTQALLVLSAARHGADEPELALDAAEQAAAIAARCGFGLLATAAAASLRHNRERRGFADRVSPY
ncbi:helix-turn-helix domain-containing protein [Kribbella sandramycini]|uniref:DNA-binding SARP family transcriptional activator/DNA-binding XRE family transcriptional regulator n=1 Tax=Kribbella sandramycini TaxID=60450 RepID=A0A7Y4NZ23_9ACTN|nr:BTAD domain-containing putative transcriptional regulator [Kribbella sandramycini]MBB6569790.1 DNA-binding SARP family transcriptional activator/DNA-binding XRE family transcriptional regulator [Kribbella sandramycini]NOL40383.1 helix-turn-helix domain-containing protein [Kribbella sandramycini]